MNNDHERKIKLMEKMKDHRFYLETFCKIKSKSEGIVPFKLRNYQLDLFNNIRKYNRIIILKSRQLGISTAVAGYFYVDSITRQGITSAIIGYNSTICAELLERIKTFYDTTPKEFRPQIERNSKFEFSFPKTNSKIIILSSDKAGRGYTLQNCHVTELSLWEQDEEKMAALENSVPLDGKIIIESTPKGAFGSFYKIWENNQAYRKLKYGWWLLYTREEIEMIKLGMNNPRKFAEEYNCEFLASGRTVFDVELIRDGIKNILNVGDKNGVDDQVVTQDKDGLIIFKAPELDHFYSLASDHSEGIDGGDYSTVCILDKNTGEEVAYYRGLIQQTRFGEMINRWGRMYNNAIVVPDASPIGLVAIYKLRELAYPNFYFRNGKEDGISITFTDRIGWKTNPTNHFNLIDNLAQALRDKTLTIHNKYFYSEMNTYIYNDNNDMVTSSGYYDDCICATAMAYQGLKKIYSKPLEQIDYRQYLPSNFAY